MARIQFILVCLFVYLSYVVHPILKELLDIYFVNDNSMSIFQSFFLSIGSAFIGATAIVFSLIMFAMQVNVERMPYGLFRKFGTDQKLLGSFFITFILAIFISSFNFLSDQNWLAEVIIIVFWCISIILSLFLYAYTRALKLINPIQQLEFILLDNKKYMRSWDTTARRMTPLIKTDQDNSDDYDVARTIYFNMHPEWTKYIEKSIDYCNYYASGYAEKNEHEISRLAFNAIAIINNSYIQVKGKTFFSYSQFGDNPFTSDAIINHTLEHIRKNIQNGLSRKDELFLDQNFQLLFTLIQSYYEIDYTTEHSSDYHAHLAIEYLVSGVEECFPHVLVDLLMNGMRILGKVLEVVIVHNDIEHIPIITKKISLFSSAGAMNKKLEPVSKIAVEQLANTSILLIRSNAHNIKYVTEEIDNAIKLISESFLQYSVDTTPFTNSTSAALEAYYSSTSNTAFQWRLTELINALLKADADNADAKRIVEHLVQWSDGVYTNAKILLLLSIEKKSFFAFDMIHWISQVSKLLLVLSVADCCDSRVSSELRKNAIWLIYTFSFIPKDFESIQLVENYNLSEQLFEVADEALERGLNNESIKITELLFSQATKPAQYDNTRSYFVTALLGYIFLNFKLSISEKSIIDTIENKLISRVKLSNETQTRIIDDLNDSIFADSRGYYGNSIERSVTTLDQNKLKSAIDRVVKLFEQNIGKEGSDLYRE